MRVLVVAESPVVRAGLESILVRESDVTVVGGVSSGDGTLAQQIEEHDPDVVLLELGPEDEADVARPVLVSAPSGGRAPAVVVIAQSPDGALVAAALRSGARVVLARDATGEEIVAATRAAAAGLAAFPSALMDGVLRAAPSPARESAAAPDAELSPRELEVLRMLAEGLGNKQIAGRLGVSEHTVKFHLGSIFQKLHASTRTEAVTIGLRRGLLLL